MAIFNWHISSIKKGGAARHSRYVGGIGEFASKAGEVLWRGCGNLPAFCGGRPEVFFYFADLYERQNGCACRELVLSLPVELRLEQWVLLTEAYIERDLAGKPYQYGIHLPHRETGETQHPHVHILYSDRMSDEHERSENQFFNRFNPGTPQLGGCRKGSGGQSPNQLRLEVFGRKDLWADVQNHALAAAGHSVHVSRMSPKPTIPQGD